MFALSDHLSSVWRKGFLQLPPSYPGCHAFLILPLSAQASIPLVRSREPQRRTSCVAPEAIRLSMPLSRLVWLIKYGKCPRSFRNSVYFWHIVTSSFRGDARCSIFRFPLSYPEPIFVSHFFSIHTSYQHGNLLI